MLEEYKNWFSEASSMVSPSSCQTRAAKVAKNFLLPKIEQSKLFGLVENLLEGKNTAE